MSNVANIMSAAAQGTTTTQAKKYAVTGWSTNNRMAVYDISDPSNLVLLDSLDNSTQVGNIRGMAWDDEEKVLYISNYSQNRINSFDLSDPSNITYLGTYSHTTYTSGCEQMQLDPVNKFLYFVTAGRYIVVLNVSDPYNMTLKTATAWDSDIANGLGVDLETGHLLVCDNVGDTVSLWKVNNVSNPTSITKQRTLTTPYTEPRLVAVDQERKKFYVPHSGQNGFVVYDYAQDFLLTYETYVQATYIYSWEYHVSYDSTFDPPIVWMGSHNSDYITALNLEDPSDVSIYKFLQDATNLDQPQAIVSDSVAGVAYVVGEGGIFSSVDISGDTWSVLDTLTGQGTGWCGNLVLFNV